MISGVNGQQKREFKAVEESKWTAVLRVYGRPNVSIFAKLYSLSLNYIRCR